MARSYRFLPLLDHFYRLAYLSHISFICGRLFLYFCFTLHRHQVLDSFFGDRSILWTALPSPHLLLFTRSLAFGHRRRMSDYASVTPTRCCIVFLFCVVFLFSCCFTYPSMRRLVRDLSEWIMKSMLSQCHAWNTKCCMLLLREFHECKWR